MTTQISFHAYLSLLQNNLDLQINNMPSLSNHRKGFADVKNFLVLHKIGRDTKAAMEFSRVQLEIANNRVTYFGVHNDRPKDPESTQSFWRGNAEAWAFVLAWLSVA